MNPRLAVVTATHNRAHLLLRLFESLERQSCTDFEWWVADDHSTDATEALVAQFRTDATFTVQYTRNLSNLGKCATLNRVFDACTADFILVIDSDEILLPEAIATVIEEVARYSDPKVGAIYFRYVLPNGDLIGPHFKGPDLIASRARHDMVRGKYDGAVGYYKEVFSQLRYPEFLGETYVGPTVLQLQMWPDFILAFTSKIIAVAEYQADGLTHAGRRLRVQNPQGMAFYCEIQRAQSQRRATRAKYAIMKSAYDHISRRNTNPESQSAYMTICRALHPVSAAGYVLGSYWDWKFLGRGHSAT